MRIRELVPWRTHRGQEFTTPEHEPLASLQMRMNRLFDQFFDGSDLGLFGRTNQSDAVAMPKIDVAETDDAVHVTAELPGLNEEDVEVTLADGQLTLRGEKKAAKEDKGKNYYRVERSYGSFHRSIPLPSGVDDAKVEASFRDGVLNIVLPKKRTVLEGKKIPVRRLS